MEVRYTRGKISRFDIYMVEFLVKFILRIEIVYASISCEQVSKCTIALCSITFDICV